MNDITDDVIQNICAHCSFNHMEYYDIYRTRDHNGYGPVIINFHDRLNSILYINHKKDNIYDCQVIISHLEGKDYNNQVVTITRPISFDNKNDIADLLLFDHHFDKDSITIYNNQYNPNKAIVMGIANQAIIERMNDKELKISLYNDMDISNIEKHVSLSKDTHTIFQ